MRDNAIESSSNDVPYLSVVVPCYNESKCIRELHRRLEGVCDGLLKPYEIVYVNDGSSDGTWNEICAFAAHNRATVGVNLSRNFGQQAAIVAGLNETSGDRVLIADADLQNPPELLPKMLELMDDNGANELVLSAALLMISYVTRAYEMGMSGEGRFATAAFPFYLVAGKCLWSLPRSLSAVLLALSATFLMLYSSLLAAGFTLK